MIKDLTAGGARGRPPVRGRRRGRSRAGMTRAAASRNGFGSATPWVAGRHDPQPPTPARNLLANLAAEVLFDAMNAVRWGVLGYARIARESVMPALQRADLCSLAAVASREESKLKDCAARFPGVRTHLGYGRLLADPEIEAVYIPLPNALHREWTIRAAEAGKHVLCEKPMGLNPSECRDMIAACRHNGVHLMEAFMYRYTDLTHKVVYTLRSGALGRVRFVQSSFRFHLSNPASIKWQPALGGGSLYDVGCYPINFCGLVADLALGSRPGDARPEEVAAVVSRQGGVDAIASGILRFPGGLIASLHSGFDGHPRIFSEIVGTDGLLEVPNTFLGEAEALVLTRGKERIEIAVEGSDRYRLEVEDFSRAIRERRPPSFSLDETLRNAEVLDRLLAAVI